MPCWPPNARKFTEAAFGSVRSVAKSRPLLARTIHDRLAADSSKATQDKGPRRSHEFRTVDSLRDREAAPELCRWFVVSSVLFLATEHAEHTEGLPGDARHGRA